MGLNDLTNCNECGKIITYMEYAQLDGSCYECSQSELLHDQNMEDELLKNLETFKNLARAEGYTEVQINEYIKSKLF